MIKPSQKKSNLNTASLFIYLLIVCLVVLQMIIVISNGYYGLFHFIGRLSGLIGMTFLFTAILLSSFVRQSKKIFGIVYLKIHHFFSFWGLIFITLHPISLAISFSTLQIFIPDFSSWNAFLVNGGRPALYLIYFAVAAAFYKKYLRQSWRYFHALIYPAFLLGFVHGYWSGTDLANRILYWLYLAMLILVLLNFLNKRYQLFQRNKKVNP